VFDAHGFLRLAQQYDLSTACEAECRTGVSRTHYAVFLLARDQMVAAGVNLGDLTLPDVHGKVEKEFKRGGKYSHVRVKERYKALRLARNDADYVLGQTVGPEQLTQALDDAEYVLGAFRAVFHWNV